MINQRSYNFQVGHGSATCAQVGCTICCIAEIIGTTPDVVNKRLLAVDGFLGNLVKWAWIEKAFPGVKAYRYYGYDNNFVKSYVPNVMCEVSSAPIGGSPNGKHWIVYKGNKQCGDPWTGSIRPTADFGTATGYVTITGRWAGLIPSVNWDNKVDRMKSALNSGGNSESRAKEADKIFHS